MFWLSFFFGNLSLGHWVHSHLSGKSRQTQAYMARFGLSKSQVRAKTCGILAKIIREIRVSYRITMEIRIYLAKRTIEDYSQIYENREPACFRMKIYTNQQQAKRLPAKHGKVHPKTVENTPYQTQTEAIPQKETVQTSRSCF